MRLNYITLYNHLGNLTLLFLFAIYCQWIVWTLLSLWIWSWLWQRYFATYVHVHVYTPHTACTHAPFSYNLQYTCYTSTKVLDYDTFAFHVNAMVFSQCNLCHYGHEQQRAESDVNNTNREHGKSFSWWKLFILLL